MDNMELLKETLDVIETGCYLIGDKVKMLKLDTARLEMMQVLLRDCSGRH